MRAGQLNQRIKIQELTDARDPIGGKTNTWTDVCSAWASVKQNTGAEYLAAKEVDSSITHEIRMRARKDVEITSAMRVSWNERILEIVTPPRDPYSRNRTWILMCKELL